MQLFKITYSEYNDIDKVLSTFIIASNERDAKYRLQNYYNDVKISFIRISQITYYEGWLEVIMANTILDKFIKNELLDFTDKIEQNAIKVVFNKINKFIDSSTTYEELCSKLKIMQEFTIKESKKGY